MPTHAWRCSRCKRRIGRIVTHTLRPSELYITLPGVRVQSSSAGHWVITCTCKKRLTFSGRSVHIDDDRPNSC